MHRAQEQVRDFHRACDLRRPETPRVRWGPDTLLRLRLIEEEFNEVVSATSEEDLLMLIRELCDLLYVTYGYLVAIGVDVEPFFEEVQRANMEKAGAPKREDGKQLKPEGWHEPDMRGVFLRTYNGNVPRSFVQ